MSINLRNTEISKEIACETEPVDLTGATEFLRTLKEQRIYRRMADIFWGQPIPEFSPAKLVVLDKIFRDARPRTIISTGDWQFGLIAWLFCPTLDELVTFGNDVHSELVAEIMNEVTFNRYVLGDVVQNIREWKEGAELVWLDGDSMSIDGLPFPARAILINDSECGYPSGWRNDKYEYVSTDAGIQILRYNPKQDEKSSVD